MKIIIISEHAVLSAECVNSGKAEQAAVCHNSFFSTQCSQYNSFYIMQLRVKLARLSRLAINATLIHNHLHISINNYLFSKDLNK